MLVTTKCHHLISCIAIAAVLWSVSSPARAQVTDGSCQPSVSVNNKSCLGGTQPYFVVNNECNCPVTVKILDSEGKSHFVSRKAGESREGSYVYTCRRNPLEIRSWAAKFDCPRGRRSSAIAKPPAASPPSQRSAPLPTRQTAPPVQQPPQSSSSGPTEQQRKAADDCLKPFRSRQVAHNNMCLEMVRRGVPDSQIRECGTQGLRIADEGLRTCKPLLRN
jgi:hypothetical protein